MIRRISYTSMALIVSIIYENMGMSRVEALLLIVVMVLIAGIADICDAIKDYRTQITVANGKVTHGPTETP